MTAMERNDYRVELVGKWQEMRATEWPLTSAEDGALQLQKHGQTPFLTPAQFFDSQRQPPTATTSHQRQSPANGSPATGNGSATNGNFGEPNFFPPKRV